MFQDVSSQNIYPALKRRLIDPCGNTSGCKFGAHLPQHSSVAFVLLLSFPAGCLLFSWQLLWFQSSTKGICLNFCRRFPTGSKIPLLLRRLHQQEASSFGPSILPGKPGQPPLHIQRRFQNLLLLGSLTHDRRWSGTLFISTTMINLVQTIRIYVSIVCPEHNRTCWKL